MAEDNQGNKESQKTIVSFVVGLLIGGLLVWAFPGSTDEAHVHDENDTEDTEMTTSTDDMTVDESDAPEGATETPRLSVGEGNIVVEDQPAGTSIALETAEYPVSEGWIGVRQFDNEELGYILGVNRFSESQGLVPENIELVQSTTPGHTYAIVVYEEDGDFDFSLAGDAQIDTIFDTFTAQ